MAEDPKKILTMTNRDLQLWTLSGDSSRRLKAWLKRRRDSLLPPGAVVSRLVWKSQRPLSGRHPAERGRRATRASRPVASRTLQRLACRILSSR